MGFFGSLTGGDQKKQIRKGAAEAEKFLTEGEAKARGELTTGYSGARTDITGGYDRGRTDVTSGYQAAIDRLDPYARSGTQARSMYDTALGINGQPAQRSFYDTYASSDPFRQFNLDQTNKSIERSFNAGGNLGSGRAALAASRANLERGSIDLNAYLDRLAGAAASGQQAAGQIAGFEAGRGQDLGTMSTQQGTALGNLSVGQGSDLASLSYGNAQQLAGNRIGMRNGLANAQTAGVNNLLNLGSSVFQAFTPGLSGQSAAGNAAQTAMKFLGG